MLKKGSLRQQTAAAVLLFSLLFSAIEVSAQDLVSTSDLTAGASVFVLRSSSRSKSSSAIASRSKAQKAATAQRIRKQYERSAAITPKRPRLEVVTPDQVPVNIKSVPPAKASVLFAGVGEYYLNRSDFDNSINFFREATEIDPSNTKAKQGLSEVLATKGNELLRKDQAATAKAYFLEALKYDPKNAAAYFGLGDSFSELNVDDDAIANYEKALAADPSLTEIYVPLGILYFQKGEIAKADSFLTKAVAASEDTAETQLFLGMIRASQNRNTEALAALTKARTLDPTMAEAAYQKGLILMRLGQLDNAISEFKAANTLKNNYFDAWLALGDAQYAKQDYISAIASYQQAKRLKNDNVDAVTALADAQRMAGKFNDAAGSYDLAITLLTRKQGYDTKVAADLYSKKGFVVGQQCMLDFARVVACSWSTATSALEKAIQLGGGDPADFANLGWAYYNASRIDAAQKRDADRAAKLRLALANLEKAVAANPKFVAGPLLNLGIVRGELGDQTGAIDALKKASEKQPDWAIPLNELGIAYRNQNNFKEAVSWFRKAVAKDDKLAAAHFNLGESLYRSGDTKAAKKEIDILTKLGSKDLAARLRLIVSGAVLKPLP